MYSQILSMIEEAAGTSLYEKKRKETTNLIERKDGKMKELDVVKFIFRLNTKFK